MAHLSQLGLSVKVTRTSYGLPVLNLNDKFAISSEGAGYQIIGGSLGPGDVSWRKTVVSSPWVEGEATVMAVKEQMHAPIGVRCLAQSLAELTDVVQQVCSAFSQYRYTVEVIINDTPWGTWLCDQADWSIGAKGVYDEFQFRALMQEIRFTVPRIPTPSAGAL